MASKGNGSAKTRGWFAQATRQENVTTLKENLPELPDFLADTSASAAKTSSQQPTQELGEKKLSPDLKRLEQQNQRHLDVPRVKEKWIMGKLSMFGLALGLALMGVIFFVAGFLVCFVTFPPSSLSSYNIAREAQLPAVEATQGYAQRDAQYAATNGTASDILIQAENRAIQESISQGKSIAQDTANQWINKVQNALGPTLGSIFSAVARPTSQTIIGGAGVQVSQTAFGPTGRPVPGGAQAASTTLASAGTPDGATPAPAPIAPPATPPAAPAPAPTSPPSPSTGTHSPSPALTPQENQATLAMSTGQEVQHAATQFSVTIQTYADSRDAYGLYNSLKERGFSAYIVRRLEGDQPKFEVRLGDFKTFVDAEGVSRSLRSQMDLPARIVLVNTQEDRIVY